ncbi:LamG domain-containing protein [Planctomycetota bacterium]
MKKVIIVLSLCLIQTHIYAVEFAGGAGEPNDPYQIAAAEQLIGMGDDPNLYDKHFILTADIDLNPNLPGRKVFKQAVIAPDTDAVEPFFQGTAFSGHFDGQGHVIHNLYIQGHDYVGLFGRCEDWAVVVHMCLEALVINGNLYVGGLVGDYVSGFMDATHCTGAVSGGGYVGILVGSHSGGSISRSYTRGTVEGAKSVGGLVGWNAARIESSYSTALVRGDHHIGGLVGYQVEGTVVSSYSIGTVHSLISSKYVGGLVGNNRDGSVSSSFWDMETSSRDNSHGGAGLLTADMYDINTYLDAGWDFIGETTNGTEDLWWINEGKDYPKLWWELVPIMPLAHLSLDVNDIVVVKRGRSNSGIFALDVTGNGNDGVLEGDITWIDDPDFGTVLAFDGVDDRIVIADGDFIDFTQPCSVAFWVKTDTNNIDNVILSKGNGNGSWQRGEKMVEIVSSNSWANMWRGVPVGAIEFEGSWIGGVGGSTDVTDGVWHHVAVTWNGEVSGAIYIDGVMETLSFNSYDGSLADNVGDAIYVGARDDKTFTGSIVDIRLYDEALTEAQIKLIKEM